MSEEELHQRVNALRARAQQDKDIISKLKDVNDSLREELQAKNDALSGQAAGTGSALASCRERIVYLPKEKKCTTFTGGISATFYDWLDELNATLSYRPFTGAEKAAFIYEQLGGEARQEIKYQPQAVRSDPDQVLDILTEIYGRPSSLTKLQRQFFERRQREGESVREYSHALMAIMEEINHCKVSKTWAGEFALRDQFAENLCDISLRRELKKVIRQQSTLSFFDLRKEALQWEEEAEFGSERRKKTVDSCETGALAGRPSVVTAAVEVKPDPTLAKVLGILQQQQTLINDLSQKVANLHTSGPRRAPFRRREPRFDPTGQPICFNCQKVGHIARYCDDARVSYSQGRQVAAATTIVSDGAVQMSEQAGN